MLPTKILNKLSFGTARARTCNLSFRGAQRRGTCLLVLGPVAPPLSRFLRQGGTITRAVVAALVLLTLTACRRNPPQSAQSAVERYPFTGRIVTIDAEDQSAVIDGDKIPGYMDAMAMSYKIKPPSMLSQLSPGDSISAELVQAQPDENEHAAPINYWLEKVKVTAHKDTTPAAGPNALHMPAPGDDVPTFSLINQNGEPVSLRKYRGNVVLVTFIYTRCPFPDFCPRMSSNFAQIYKQLNTDPSLARVRLLSISFDPEHDTPKVLREYAFSAAHTREAVLFDRWEFAVPHPADLPKIADFFGLVYKPEGGMITHNLSTTVIGPDGKVVQWYHGGDWQVSDLIKDATSALPRKG